MDKAFGSTRLFSLRRAQDVPGLTGGSDGRPPSPGTAQALGKELHAAVRWGDVESTRRLLQAGADPSVASEDLRATPLHIAAMLGRTIWSNEPVYDLDVALRLVRELLQGGADVNALDQYGFNSLHLAAATGDMEMVSLLLRSGANPNTQDFELLFTPLHVAISNGNMDVALMLIEAGVDTARTDYTGRSAWQVFAKDLGQGQGQPTAAAAGVGSGATASDGGGAGAAARRPDGPRSMLQLLLTGLQQGRAIPVSAVFNLVLEILGSRADPAGKAPAGAAGTSPGSRAVSKAAFTAPAGGATGDDDGSGPVGVMVRQLVITIRDLGDLHGCWQLLAEAVRCGAAAVAALVVSAVVALHPASLGVIPWGAVLVDLLACMPGVFDQLVAELALAPSQHLSSAVRRLHPSRLEPSTRLLLYRRLVAALRQQGNDGVVARAFLQDLPPDTVADLAGTPFFQEFTQLLSASATKRTAAAASAEGHEGPAASDLDGDTSEADLGAGTDAAATEPGQGTRGLMLQSSAGGPIDPFAATNLLQGALQSGSLLAVDYVVQSILSWQQSANVVGRRALLLGLNSELLDWLATSFPTSCRALMQMPRQRGPLMHVRLPRASRGRDGQQLFRCSSTTAHHLVWWPRLTHTLTAGPLAVGDVAEVEGLLAGGLPLESLHAVVAGRERRRRRGSADGAGGDEGGSGGGVRTGLASGEEEARTPGSAAWKAVAVCSRGRGNAVVPVSAEGAGEVVAAKTVAACAGAAVAEAGMAGVEEADGGGGGCGSTVALSEVAQLRELLTRGLTAEQVNSLVCSGTTLSSVVAALDHGVPLRLIAGLLDAGLCFQVVEALLHRSVHQSTRYWKLRPHNELFFKLPFATWHNGIGYAFFGPFLTEWASAGWSRGFIDRIFHTNDPLGARLKAAYDYRGVPQRLPPPMMAAYDPRLAAAVQRRLLLLRVFLAAWWLPQRWTTAALLAAAWSGELGARWWLLQGPAALRGQLWSQQEQLVPHDAVAEMLPVHGIARVGRAGLLQGLIKARVPSDWYSLELPRAVVVVHWEGYARALFAMQGLEHVLIMGFHAVFLWALRCALMDAERMREQRMNGGGAGSSSSGDGDGWPLQTARLSVPLLFLSWAATAGLALELLRAHANGFAAYRLHQANWLRVAMSCLTLATLAVLLAGGSRGGVGGGGDKTEASRGGNDAWWRALQVALALGSVQVLLLCYQLLLFSSLSDGMGGLVRMVVEVVKSMGYFFLMLAIVFGGFTAAFVTLMTTSLDLTAFVLRLFTVMLGDFANDQLNDMLGDGTFLVPALGVVLMAAYGVVLVIVLVNLLIAIMTDAYAKVRSSEGAEVAHNQAYIINDLQLGLSSELAERIEAALLGPYLHVMTITAAEAAAVKAPVGRQRTRMTSQQ